jgi:hypothetical protein
VSELVDKGLIIEQDGIFRPNIHVERIRLHVEPQA